MMDKAGNKVAQLEIAMIKVAAPRMALHDHRRRHPGPRRRRRVARTSAWPTPTPSSAPCAWPTARTRSTTAPSRAWSSPSTPTASAALMSEAEARFEGVKPVEERHRIDEAALAAWMEANVEGFAGPADGQPVQGRPVEPDLPAGHAGPDLRAAPQAVRDAAALGPRRGPRVQGHLGPARPGLPGRASPTACATDDARHRGHVLRHGHGRGPGLLGRRLPEPDAGRAPRHLRGPDPTPWPQLHTFDPDAIGLGDYGKPGNYFARQVERWTKQYRASETETDRRRWSG